MAMAAAAAATLMNAVAAPLASRKALTVKAFGSSSIHWSSAAASVSCNFFCKASLYTTLGTDKRPPKYVSVCLASLASRSSEAPATKLYVSGLSFRTSEEGLRNAFRNFGELVEVHLVMDKIANRPRGFAFLRYATEEESKKAIAGMHGKFLDGRVIFVEVAKPRSELRKSGNQSPWLYQ